ncbi:MAG: acyltransferase family protein [Oscillospiraceae bacterium]|nr:acyltransferase family protein [Oscillospiraceae bacterium]
MSITKRSAGIELLRILLMVMILILHINLQGGVLYNTPFGGIRYFSGWLLEALCYGAVNGYAMITGYVSCESNFSYKKIIPIWLQVFFWNSLINAVFILSGAEDLKITAASFLPVTSDAYWYFTAYFGMFFFIPFFNKLIKQLDFKNFTILIATMFVLFSFYAGCLTLDKDIFLLKDGYSMLWLSVMYFFGAYEKQCSPSSSLKKHIWLIVFLVSSAIPAISSCMLYIATSSSLGDNINPSGDMLLYNSPFLVIAAYALLVLFKDINIKDQKLNSLICFFSAGSFGVYLIHTQPLFFERIVHNMFADYAKLSTPLMLICIIATAIAAYIVLASAEKLRILLFDLLRIKSITFKAADTLTEKILSMKLK